MHHLKSPASTMSSITSRICRERESSMSSFSAWRSSMKRGWQCFLKCGNQGVALFEVDDDEEVHAGSEVNHMALRWPMVISRASKRR